MDFFVSGRAKELVNTHVEINTKGQLKERINAPFQTMKQEMMLKITTMEQVLVVPEQHQIGTVFRKVQLSH
ncbi:hypothetical protein evm_013226 [Chilo suppressalis]|nr:hypothetical protein evm_013226 [Chilo suppressalis]